MDNPGVRPKTPPPGPPAPKPIPPLGAKLDDGTIFEPGEHRQPMIDFAQSPTVRVRINHSKTIKNGWGHETTVEVTSYDGSFDGDDMESLLALADHLGRQEADRRNDLDGLQGAE